MKNLAICMIVKGNEWDETRRCIDSFIDYVDQVFITTTQVEKKGILHRKITYSHFPWVNDFAKARNFNFSQAKEYRYLMWVDSDDIVEGAEYLPKLVDKMDESDIDSIFMDYNYEIDPKSGEVVIVHPRERIIKNDGSYTWKGALHETMVCNKSNRTEYSKDVVINHYPSEENRAANLKRNLDVMVRQYNEERKAVANKEKDEIDPRTEYYLGRILFDIHTKESHERASELFQDYLLHSGWDAERAQAWNYLGHIFFNRGKFDDAITCYLSAEKESPQYPTWQIMISRAYCAMEKWEQAEAHVLKGLAIPQPPTALIVSPRDDKINALMSLFMISFHKKDLKKTLRYAQMIDEIRPSKENHQRVEGVERLIEIGDWMKTTSDMVKEMDKLNQQDRIQPFLDSLPESLQRTVHLQLLKNEYLPPKVWGAKSIVYYAASQFEPWTPKSLEKGIGGSEEAIIYLTKLWASKGYEVTVYNNAGGDEGVYDGVNYVNYQKFNPYDKFNVLIGWRSPHFFKYNTFDANLTLLDLHDVPEVEEYTQDVVDKIDYIMVKSEFHRRCLPDIPKEKFKIINNGIDLDLLSKVKGKNARYRLFWGSSYDRGLQNLLSMWSDIKAREPLAELHICYGWNLFDKLNGHVPHLMRWKNEMVRMMEQPGIIHHGRVGKEELYKIAKSCGIWAYPTEFPEISCITAMYCQALGAIPVVSNYAALQTTVWHGVKVDTVGEKKLDFNQYKEALISLILDGKRQQAIRNDMNGNFFDWKTSADKWLEIPPKKPEAKLSIITPTIRTGWWNVMSHNLSKQTYKNFEWIIVDDYKENRNEIAKKYAKKYNLNIKYIYKPKRTNKKPRKYGLSSANNAGWKAATGSLCVWLQDFTLLLENSLHKLARLHERLPNYIIAPTDKYYQSKIKPNINNSEDWFGGKTDIIGKHMRTNARIKKGKLRPTTDYYELELNFGAIPKSILESLNGFWEFYDDALGYDDTELPYRAFKAGYKMVVDESLVCACIDHWEPLKDRPDELGIERTHNLNDPRFIWMANKMKEGKLPLKRSQKRDDSIDLKYTIPPELSKDEAVVWMKKNLEKIVAGWK